MSERCGAKILSLIDGHDGMTALFGCEECGWEERYPVTFRNGGWNVATTYWCRKNPSAIEVGLGGACDEAADALRITVTKT